MANWILLSTLAVFACLAVTAESRTTCKDDTRPCLTGEPASCRDDVCRCNIGYRGLGQLRCVPNDRYVCTIANDPKGTPFSGGPSADLALPCRYLATDVTVRDPGTDFWCRSRVFVYGWRFRGKIFLIGYDIRLDWEGDGLSRYTFSIKAYGKKNLFGNYQWDLLTRHSKYLGGEEFQRNDISLTVMDEQLKGTNVFGIDAANNRVQFISTVCGIDTAFRLPDPEAGIDQPDLPGLVVAVDPNAGEVVFNDVEGSVCLTPALTVEAAVAEIDPSLEVGDAFLYKIAAYSRGQSFPLGDTAQCTKLEEATAACDDPIKRRIALESCSFSLQNPHFLNCYSIVESSGDVLEFFVDCVRSFCENVIDLCDKVKEKLKKKPQCVPKAPEAIKLANESCANLLSGQ